VQPVRQRDEIRIFTARIGIANRNDLFPVRHATLRAKEFFRLSGGYFVVTGILIQLVHLH
jgi:hypothetical protein